MIGFDVLRRTSVENGLTFAFEHFRDVYSADLRTVGSFCASGYRPLKSDVWANMKSGR